MKHLLKKILIHELEQQWEREGESEKEGESEREI